MEHFGDFIDYDEGRIDPREPFFTEAIPCESCGAPCDETRPAPWDTSLNVGPCCYQEQLIPDEPVCPGMEAALMRFEFAHEVLAAMKAHRECCETCRVEVARKGIVGEVGDRRRERAA
jgi:hypothetical protein